MKLPKVRTGTDGKRRAIRITRPSLREVEWKLKKLARCKQSPRVVQEQCKIVGYLSAITTPCES